MMSKKRDLGRCLLLLFKLPFGAMRVTKNIRKDDAQEVRRFLPRHGWRVKKFCYPNESFALCAKDAKTRCVSFGYFSFAQAKKSNAYLLAKRK